MNSFILDSLNYYYNLKKIDTNLELKFTNELYNLMPILYIKESNKFIKKIYNIIGIYEIENNIFHWAWASNLPKQQYYMTNKLILHGINIDLKSLQDIYIKKLLTSSKIKIDNDFQLTILSAISCYLTKNHGFIVNQYGNYSIFYGIYDIKDVDETIIL